MQNDKNLLLLKGYLLGIENLNTTFYYVNLFNTFEISEYAIDKSFEEIFNLFFQTNDNEQHHAKLIAVEDWVKEITNACKKWFFDGFRRIAVDRFSKGFNKEPFDEVNSKIKDIYDVESNVVNKFIELLNLYIGSEPVSLFKIESDPDFFYECDWDDYLIVCKDKIVTIHFGLSD